LIWGLRDFRVSWEVVTTIPSGNAEGENEMILGECTFKIMLLAFEISV